MFIKRKVKSTIKNAFIVFIYNFKINVKFKEKNFKFLLLFLIFLYQFLLFRIPKYY